MRAHDVIPPARGRPDPGTHSPHGLPGVPTHGESRVSPGREYRFITVIIITEVREASVGVHDRRRRDRTDAHGAARDEQLRESKRPWSSSFALIDDTVFDGVVRVHRRGCVEE